MINTNFTRFVLLALILLCGSNLGFAKKGGYVKGYYKSNGTYVAPYYRNGTTSGGTSGSYNFKYDTNSYDIKSYTSPTYVEGYFRKDGTYVQGHFRGLESSIPKVKAEPYKAPKYDNYSGWGSYLENENIKVIDGDTFWYGGKRYRVNGIDTPEKGEAGYYLATERLKALLSYSIVRVQESSTDVYGRTVAKVYVNGRNVAEVMKEEGLQK